MIANATAQINRRRWTAGRIVLAVLFSVVLGFAIVCAVVALIEGRELRRAEVHRTIDKPVDFSQTGSTEGVLDEVFLRGHGAALLLKVSSVSAKEDPKVLLAGLSGTIGIRDSEEGKIPLTAETCGMRDDGAICIWSYHPSKKGQMPLTIEITSGAPALAGRVQRFVGQYGLCGLESFAVWVPGAAAVVAGLIAAALGSVFRKPLATER